MTTIQIKSSETVNAVPTSGQLQTAELAVNLADGKLFSKKSDGTIVTLAGNTTATTYYIPTILGMITEAADFGTDFGSITSSVSSGNMQDTNTNSDVTFNSVTTSGLTSHGQLLIDYTGNGNGASSVKVSGYNSKGGTGYHDFLQATNQYSSATNPNKYFRLTSNGALELLNSAYSATILSIADNGVINLPNSSATSNLAATTNAINFGSVGQIYNDGNFHIHSNTGQLWINALDGSDIAIGTQNSSGTSSVQLGGTLKMNSGYGSIAPAYGVRAWINCGWNGSSMVTRGSGNLSVSRSSAGTYVFTFGTAMPDRNYCINVTAQTPVGNSDVAANIAYNVTPTTTGFTIQTARYGDGFKDVSELHVQVVR